MPGYAFNVTMKLTNPTNAEQIVSIPRGTILEPDKAHLTDQSAVIAKDYIFRLNPNETRSVLLEAECWNRHLAPPKGTPGKLTPLKGNVMKTTNVWGTSSTPSQTTITTKPSQPPNVFAAFANTSPDFAYDFLNEVTNEADSRGVDVSDALDALMSIGSPARSKDSLLDVAKDPELGPYINGTKIRQYFIQKGAPTDDQINAIERLIKNVYALTTHSLASRQFVLAMEMADLSKDRQVTLKDEEREELTQLIREKYLTLLDSLPLLDQIEWRA